MENDLTIALYKKNDHRDQILTKVVTIYNTEGKIRYEIDIVCKRINKI